ncbi:MAG TPA: 50S ribosomal protein L25 [Candidatus Paceibacterota bacterium]
MLQLKAESRKTGEGEALRKVGKIPAVFYGHKEKSTPIAVTLKDFKKVLKIAGESSVISIVGMGEDKEALIHDVDFEPVTGVPRHADFYIIEKGRTVQVMVPLNFVGTSSAMKELGGILVKVLHEIEIEAMPKDLPHEIEVDISALENFESKIEVKDIKVASGVTILAKPEDVVALVSEPKEEVIETTPPEAPDLSAIEVEKRGKEEEAEASEAEETAKE